MKLSKIPELNREELERKFPKKDYCISFYPVEDDEIDVINVEQIFLKLTEPKAEELAELFERTNKENKALKITIEIFEIDD